MVVEKVVKLVVEVGFLVFLGEKEEEEGGMEVLLLLEMEEEMEERKVEKLVVEMEVGDGGWKGWERWPTMGARAVSWLPFRSQEREGKEKE